MSTNESNKTELLSIKEVCREYDLSEVYVRRMYLKGTLKSAKKVQIATNTYKVYFTREEVERWRKQCSMRTRRTDGRGKYTLYANKEEYEQIRQILAENKLQTEVRRANKVKEISND